MDTKSIGFKFECDEHQTQIIGENEERNSEQLEQWNLKELQIHYASLDAFISYMLGCKVLEKKID